MLLSVAAVNVYDSNSDRENRRERKPNTRKPISYNNCDTLDSRNASAEMLRKCSTHSPEVSVVVNGDDVMTSSRGATQEQVVAVVVCSLVIIVCLFAVILLAFRLKLRRRRFQTSHDVIKTAPRFGGSGRSQRGSRFRAQDNADVILDISGSNTLSRATPLRTCHAAYNLMTSDSDRDSPATCYNVTSATESIYNHTEMPTVYDAFQTRTLPSLPRDSTGIGEKELRKSNWVNISNNLFADTLGSSRNNTLGSIQGVTGNNLYAAPDVMSTHTPLTARRVIEFSREQLRPIERLGVGQFGEVHLIIGDFFAVYVFVLYLHRCSSVK